MLGFKLNHVSKRGPWSSTLYHVQDIHDMTCDVMNTKILFLSMKSSVFWENFYKKLYYRSRVMWKIWLRYSHTFYQRYNHVGMNGKPVTLHQEHQYGNILPCQTYDALTHWSLGCDFINSIFNLAFLIGIVISSYENALRWLPWDLMDDKSTLVQIMAWCRQATSHYLSQCWPRSMSPNGVTMS